MPMGSHKKRSPTSDQGPKALPTTPTPPPLIELSGLATSGGTFFCGFPNTDQNFT